MSLSKTLSLTKDDLTKHKGRYLDMEILNIQTSRLIIRHLELSDLYDFHFYRSNPDVTKYQGFDVMTIEQAEEFIKINSAKHFGKAGEWVQYGIENIEKKQLIGDCAIKLDQFDTRIASIGITISHFEQNKGFAKEALLGILTFLFDTKKLHRVVEIVDEENIASINLLKSVGFKQEGHFIENIFFNGKWGNEFQYAMLKREWDDRNTKKNYMKNPIIPLYKQTDRYIVRSENCYVYDSDNKRYIDFESGDWSSSLGHSNPIINERIKQQVDKLIHDGLRFRNIESEQLSIKLLEKIGLIGGQCAYVNSGSEAVNLGLSIAKKVTGRSKILKMDCSYLSAFGHGQICDKNTDLLNIPIDNIDAISNINFEEIAAFAFEPGNSFCIIKYPSTDFIAAIVSEIKKHGGLLMANEVTTGFGRTGKWFGFQHYDYKPDIVSVGKALGNGYPISGVAISSEISELFQRSPFRYAQSHQNDALGCAVGLEVISAIEKLDLINKGFEKGEYFKQSLLRLQTKHPVIVDLRARGLMIGIELKTNEIADYIYNQLIEKGFLVGLKEKTLRFMPPLTIEKSHIDELIETIDKIITNTKQRV